MEGHEEQVPNWEALWVGAKKANVVGMPGKPVADFAPIMVTETFPRPRTVSEPGKGQLRHMHTLREGHPSGALKC